MIVVDTYKGIQQVFKVLADGNRLRIVEALSKECRSVNEIADEMVCEVIEKCKELVSGIEKRKIWISNAL